MKAPDEEELKHWIAFINVRWARYAREHGWKGGKERKFLRVWMAGGYTLLDAILQMERGRECKKMSDNEYASIYPEEVKKKKIVSEIKQAGKYARDTFNPGTGIGKSAEAISPGKKKKKK
jgi:hypothetical protein